MATLILSTAGTIAAGPVGGMLGTLAGQAIDQQLMGGGPRRGPRLGDLSVQTSAYGTMVPRVYGTMRIAGTVIWATDLKEVETLQGDGKSGPETVVYLYSASFAVALSSRPAQRVGRVWADGKLVRGAAGDMKVSGTMRFLPGGEEQLPDTLIASIEGIGATPAYRGLTIAVIEDLELAPFGNRIPSLTFELVADEGGQPVGDVLRDCSDGLVDSGDSRPVGGYALYGDDLGSAIGPLIEAFSLVLTDAGGRFLERTEDPPKYLPANALGAGNGNVDYRPVERKRLPAAGIPGDLSIVYHDAARDYQSGAARAAIPGGHRLSRTLALPIVSSASEAKGLAETALQRAWAKRETITVQLPIAFLGLEPGDRVILDGVNGEWLIERVSVERMVVRIEARTNARGAASQPADPGRPVHQPDVLAAPSRLFLLDLTDWRGTSGPSLQLAVTSPSGAYRAVPIEVEVGGTISGMSSAAREAISGTVEGVLTAASSGLIDETSRIEVALTNPDHWLESRDDAAIASGANLAAVGDEIIQFGRAEPLGGGRFRLSRLLRGRGGSEHAVSAHRFAEPFVMLNPAALTTVPLAAGYLLSRVTVTAYGPANADSPPSVTREVAGAAALPLSPTHVAAMIDENGALRVTWTERSRSGWAWLDSVETRRDADFQGFRITVSGSGGQVEHSTSEHQLTLQAADLEWLGALRTVAVRQAGAFGLSPPVTFNFEV